jgi:uncharacterized protein
MAEGMFWSVLLRTGQVAIEASVTLAVGLLVAGVMRRMLGAEGTRKLFGGRGWKGLLRAWGVGMLLPVCSLGVIPIAREMRRSGVPSGTILAFVLAAPHINPLSLLYGLTLSEPIVIVCFAIGSLLIALGAGAIWERFFAIDADTPEAVVEPMPAPGLKRLAAVVVTAARESVTPTMGFLLISICFTGLLSGLLPHGCLSMTMRHDDPTSTALMTAIAMPLYTGPLQGMMRLGLIFEHGNSVGAAFALFELGIGVNLGLIIWLAVLFGWKRVLLWFVLIATVTMGLGYAAEHPLYFAHEEASHTHAFDEWTSPFVNGSGANWEVVRGKLIQKIEILEPVALGSLGMLISLGILLARLDRSGQVERWLTTNPVELTENKPRSILSRDVPAPILGMVALVGLVIFSVVALFIYYPAPKDAFVEIVRVRTEAITAARTGNKEEAIRQLELWDLLTRKLEVGVYIRSGRLGSEQAKVADDLRESIEELRDALLANDLIQAKELLPALEAAYRACKAQYLSIEDQPAISQE